MKSAVLGERLLSGETSELPGVLDSRGDGETSLRLPPRAMGALSSAGALNPRPPNY